MMWEKIKAWFYKWYWTKTVEVFCRHDISNLEHVINVFNNKSTKLGELGYPDTPKITLDRISHSIQKVYTKKGKVYAKIQILDSPCGKILKTIYKGKGIMHYGFRGTGRYECNRVVEYELHAIDAMHPGRPYEGKILCEST